jgi:GWxTD domain-containing protein
MRKYIGLGLIAASAFLSSCRLYNLERKLGPEDADFMSKVRYIMASEERKIFLEIPPTERTGFKADFWKRRDPTPETPVNEFRDEYFLRMKRATELFHGEGKDGWLTDRGRIYILFGPPGERLTYPMESGGSCREVWYYGSFPVIFVDDLCSGNYLLSAINLQHLHDLNIAQAYFQKPENQEKELFNFEASLRKKSAGPGGYEGVLEIRIPYKGISFVSEVEEARFRTTLTVDLDLRTPAGTSFWNARRTYEILMNKEDLEAALPRGAYKIEIPVVLEGSLEPLHHGKNEIQVSVKNSTNNEELKKLIEFRLD